MDDRERTWQLQEEHFEATIEGLLEELKQKDEEMDLKEEEWSAKRQKYLTMMKEKKKDWAAKDDMRREQQQRMIKQSSSLKVEWANKQHQLQCTVDAREEELAHVRESHAALKAQIMRWIPIIRQHGAATKRDPGSEGDAGKGRHHCEQHHHGACELPRLDAANPANTSGDGRSAEVHIVCGSA